MTEIRDDITQKAIELGWLKTIYPGVWMVYDPLASYMDFLQEFFYERIGRPLGFMKLIPPTIIPKRIYHRYGQEFYPVELAIEIKEFANQGNSEQLVLDPAFTSFYGSLENRALAEDILPFQVTEASIGISYRNEKDVSEFSRSREFIKKEFLFIGYPDQVRNLHIKTMTSFESCLNLLGLEHRIRENRTQIKGRQNDYQTTDFEIDINNIQLEVASAANKQNWVTSHYNIRSVSGRELWSGYLSIGLSRIMYCILSVHGFDECKWPMPQHLITYERKTSYDLQ